MTWKYLLYAQFPAFFLLSLFFLFSYVRVRKASAVKSILWVLLFGAALAVSILFLFLGMPEYWTLKTLFPLKAASWIGMALVVVAVIAHVVHVFEKRHNKKVMEKELEKAARERDDAVAQAREEGRRAAREETEAIRLSKAAADADAEASASELAGEARAPISLTLDAGTAEPPAFDPMTGQPLAAAPAEPPAFAPMTGQPLAAPPAESPAFDLMTGQPLAGKADDTL